MVNYINNLSELSYMSTISANNYTLILNLHFALWEFLARAFEASVTVATTAARLPLVGLGQGVSRAMTLGPQPIRAKPCQPSSPPQECPHHIVGHKGPEKH